MLIYNYDPITFEFTGSGVADQDPLDSTNWLIPSYATASTPFENKVGKTVNFLNGEWQYKDIPIAILEIEKAPEQKTYIQLRSLEYPSMSDYLDGVVKGDQDQINAYIAACRAVKAKYPKPV